MEDKKQLNADLTVNDQQSNPDAVTNHAEELNSVITETPEFSNETEDFENLATETEPSPELQTELEPVREELDTADVEITNQVSEVFEEEVMPVVEDSPVIEDLPSPVNTETEEAVEMVSEPEMLEEVQVVDQPAASLEAMEIEIPAEVEELTAIEVTQIIESSVANKIEVVPEESADDSTESQSSESEHLTEEPAAEVLPDSSEVDEEQEDEHDELVDDPLETEEKYQTLLREELVVAMEDAVSHDDISKVKRRISLIRVAFLNKTREEKSARFEKYIEEGGEKEAYSDAPDALEDRFRDAFSKYKDKKIIWEVEQDRVRQQNLLEKQQILEQLKELINSEESLKKTYDEFRELQEKWGQIGMVPRTENNNLWQNYHFLVEKFFDKVKINRELRDLDLKRNLESKIALCEKVEELLLEPSVDRSFRLLQQYHREWKEIGPVPMDKKEEVWERFKRTSDLINDKRREYYDQRQEEMDKNLLAKKELCEQAEAIGSSEMTSIKHWQDNTDKINELLKIWKTIGPAPRAQNDAVWTRFRNIMEAFFAAKKEYFDKLKDEQLNNYNLKLDLCVQAESLKFSTDWRKTSQELINLQKKWRDIGPVPRKHSDKIWKRFRAACDDFFQAKSAYFSNIQGKETDNLKLKEELLQKLEQTAFTEEKSENLDILKNFQREWMEIGHVPMVEKDRLQKAFRDLIDRKLKELNISSLEITKSNYRSRIDTMRDSRDGGKMISRERSQLQNKISALQEEINLWENNLGFFAESKKAQILKEEFTRKIDKAKQELALLEAKLKMLRDVD